MNSRQCQLGCRAADDNCLFVGTIHQQIYAAHRRGVLAASDVHRVSHARPAPLDRRRHGQPRRRHHHSQGPDGLQPRGEVGTAPPARLQRRRRNATSAAVGAHQAPDVVVFAHLAVDCRRRRSLTTSAIAASSC